jgi:heme exporter protein D
MTHANFVAAAFAVTAIGTLTLVVHSWISMRRSEALAEDLRQRP